MRFSEDMFLLVWTLNAYGDLVKEPVFFVERYAVKGGEALPMAEQQKAFTNALGPSVRLSQICRAVAQLRKVYVERGYSNVTVFVPKQSLTNGMNSSGFYFGPNSFVKAAGLVVSTAPGTPVEGASGANWLFTGPPPTAKIVNYGQITSETGGYVYLIGADLENQGTISTPGGSMKKCSESAHHALSELNIAPLLDLGFVLLVIFIITTTPVANDREVQLPVGELHLKESPRKPNYITVRSDGTLTVNNTSVEMSNLQPFLALMRQDDPDLSLIIRGDAHEGEEENDAPPKSDACSNAHSEAFRT